MVGKKQMQAVKVLQISVLVLSLEVLKSFHLVEEPFVYIGDLVELVH